MLTTWMAYATLLATLVYLGALAGERIVRAWRGAERFVWLAALVGATTVPALVAGGARASAVSGDSSPAGLAGFAVMTDIRHTALRFADRVERMGVALEPYVLDAWITASGVLLILVLGAGIRLRRQSTAWREVELDGVRVLIATGVGPAVIGALRTQIVVPAWMLSLDSGQRALVLRHELEHIRARDPALLLLAACTLIALPWNVALWLIVRRLRLAIEIDCDRRVLRDAVDTHEYGLLLLAVGARASGRPPFVAALVERRSLLERRIKAMTALPPRHRLLVSVPSTMFIALATVGATRAPRPALTRAVTSSANDRAEPPQVRHTLSHPRATPSDTLKRITVSYQDAPIEQVIAAFAAFTRRTIGSTKGVSGTVTADVVDKPWDVALKEIMGHSGYQVVFNSDGSITIDK